MEDDFEEMDNLMDDDPALDYILYEDMKRDQSKRKEGKGCLANVVILLLPWAASYCLLVKF